MTRRPIDKLEDRLREAVDKRRTIEDKYVRQEVMQAVSEYLRSVHDYELDDWTRRTLASRANILDVEDAQRGL